MDRKSRTQFISGMEKAFKAVGATNMEDGCEKAAKVFEVLATMIRRFGNREELEKLLAADQVSPEEQRIAVAAAEQLPVLMNVALQALSEMVAKDLPVPPKGRPKSLTIAKERQVCEYIGKLFSSGTPLKIAKQRTARKFGVSCTTVERIWADRKKNARKPSLDEIVAVFQTDWIVD